MPDINFDDDQVLASAIQYLVEGEEWEAAQALSFCVIENFRIVGERGEPWSSYGIAFTLRGPRKAVERIDNGFDPVREQVYEAFDKTMPEGLWFSSFDVRASTFLPDPNWRNDLHDLIKGKGVTNQASGAETLHFWQGFRFRSATEIKIAESLDRAGVLFFPLLKARVALEQGHRNVEPDFVVCHEGRWGILEVDGEPFHPPQRSAIEHERDRLFRRHGVVCVERFDANKCYNHPDKTVEEFLLLMVKAYRRP